MLDHFNPIPSRRSRRWILRCVGMLLAAVLSQSTQLPAQAQISTPPALKANESLRPAIEECFRIQALRDLRDTSLVELMIQVDRPPVEMGFNVSLQIGDRKLFVGPVAWKKEIGWWAYNVDVPADIKTVTILFAPSATGAAKLKRRHSYRLAGLDSIWDGESFVKTVEIKPQRLEGMMSVSPPSNEEAREDQTEQLEGDDPAIQRFKRDGNVEVARQGLERSVHDRPENAVDWFNLGCLRVIAADRRNAVGCFVKVLKIDSSSSLADKAQLQLRRIGSYFVHAARGGATRIADSNAMCGLGVMYQRGWGPKQDRQEAKKWFRSAANSGNVEAMFHLGEMYEQDSASDDNPKTKSWFEQQTLEMYRKAEELGSAEAKRWMATHDRKRLVSRSVETDKTIQAPPKGQDLPTTVAPNIDATLARRQYHEWVQLNSETSLAGLGLVITTVEGEEQAKAANDNPFGFGIARSRCKVTIDGTTSYAFENVRGHKGSSGHSMAAAEFKRLNELLDKLPDDGSRLPPAGRRVLVQMIRVGSSTSRVYDRANASAEVLEVLRLSKCGVGAWLPEFRPNSEIDARSFQHGGIFCLTPDRSKIIFSTYDRVQFWDPATHESLGEMELRSNQWNSIAFHPNGSLAALVGAGECEIVETSKWKRIQVLGEPTVGRSQYLLSAPLFTADGKFLVMQCSEPALRIFDTTTWKPVARLPAVPEDTLRYFPASGKKLAVIQSRNGTVALWDLDRQANVAELDKDCVASEVAFSPDESLVAVATRVTDQSRRQGWRLRIWKANTGEFYQELRPFEQNTFEEVQRPFWSPDGKYLLAPTKSHSFFTSIGVSVWNVKTARHRGELTGCPTRVLGAVLSPDDSELVVGCADGKIRFWNFPSVMKQIQTFENSLDGH